jgi:hypothetical protein
MPTPSSALSTLRPEIAGSLVEFDLAMDRNGFVWNRVLPVFEVAKSSGTFGRIPIEQLLQNRETKRAPGAGYARSNFTFTTDNFATEEHGAEEPVDDREAELYSDFFDAEVVAAQRAMDVVLRNAEKRVASAIFNTTTWNGAALTTGISTEWSTVASAAPITDVNAARNKVWDGSGVWPNALIITKKVFFNLRNCTQVKDAIAASGAGFATRQTDINEAMLASVFDLDYVIVAGSGKNTANEGQAISIAPIWDDEYAMVCRVATSNDIREPCIGRVFHWGQDGSSVMGTVESYRDETVRSNIIRCRHDVDEKVLYPELGHLLSNVTA